MAIRRANFATIEHTLAAAVADDGTFTVSYPTGTTQLSFNAGLAGTDHYMVVNGNDRWAYGASGFTASFDASYITITNTTGASLAAGTTILFQFDMQDGSGRIPIVMPVPDMTKIADGDVVTTIRPGIAGYLEYAEWVQTTAVTTGSKLSTLNFAIDTTNVTGGTIALTSADCTPVGKVIAAADITANNRLEVTSKLSVEASSTTAFSEGGGYIIAYVRPDFEDAY